MIWGLVIFKKMLLRVQRKGSVKLGSLSDYWKEKQLGDGDLESVCRSLVVGKDVNGVEV